MDRPNVPNEFYGGQHHLYGCFKEYARNFGDSEDSATELIRILHRELKTTHVWYDRITKKWRYEFGVPIDRLPNDYIVYGTDQSPDVEHLYLAVRTANHRLKPQDLIKWLERIADRAKHLHVLVEMRPAINLSLSTKANFEVSGLAEGNTTLDWMVIPAEKPNILLDVKHRQSSQIKHLKQIIPGIERGEQQIVPKAPDPSDLFKSTLKKFSESDGTDNLQGVWAHVEIKEDRDKLATYFKSLPANRIHFLILANWENEATIIARASKHIEHLETVFSIIQSAKFLTHDYSDSR